MVFSWPNNLYLSYAYQSRICNLFCSFQDDQLTDLGSMNQHLDAYSTKIKYPHKNTSLVHSELSLFSFYIILYLDLNISGPVDIQDRSKVCLYDDRIDTLFVLIIGLFLGCLACFF